MKESDLQKNIATALRRDGCFVSKIHGGPHQPAGLPDLIGCYEGKFFGLEVKMPGKEHKLTDRQAANLEKIERAGGINAVVTTIKESRKAVGCGKSTKTSRRRAET